MLLRSLILHILHFAFSFHFSVSIFHLVSLRSFLPSTHLIRCFFFPFALKFRTYPHPPSSQIFHLHCLFTLYSFTFCPAFSFILFAMFSVPHLRTLFLYPLTFSSFHSFSIFIYSSLPFTGCLFARPAATAAGGSGGRAGGEWKEWDRRTFHYSANIFRRLHAFVVCISSGDYSDGYE